MSRYALLYADGMTSLATLQALLPAPDDATTVGSVREGVDVFRTLARETYREGVSTEQGGPWADLVDVGTWDGVTYASDVAVRLTVGPRGGVRRTRI